LKAHGVNQPVPKTVTCQVFAATVLPNAAKKTRILVLYCACTYNNERTEEKPGEPLSVRISFVFKGSAGKDSKPITPYSRCGQTRTDVFGCRRIFELLDSIENVEKRSTRQLGSVDTARNNQNGLVRDKVSEHLHEPRHTPREPIQTGAKHNANSTGTHEPRAVAPRVLKLRIVVLFVSRDAGIDDCFYLLNNYADGS
jgi:hypothetical protein